MKNTLETKDKKTRNNLIEILKIIIACIIVFHHISSNVEGFSFFTRGLLVVDFFFIVSGYFFALSMIKERSKATDIYSDNIKFIVKKYIYFLPFLLTGFLFSLAYRIIVDKIAIHTIFNSIFSLFVLQMVGLPMAFINNVTWYISVMLVSMFIIYPLFRKKENFYSYYIAPLVVILGYGFFTMVYKNFDLFYAHDYIIMNGFLRGFADINIGIVIYYLVKNKKFNVNKYQKVFFTIIEILGYAFLFLLMQKMYSKLDIFSVLVWSVLIFIAFSNISYSSDLTRNIKIKLKDFSLALYLLHIPILQWTKKVLDIFFDLNPTVTGIIIFINAIVCTLLFIVLFDRIKKKIKDKKESQ